MPAFVISSVDTTANTVTSTGVAAAGQPEGTVLMTGDRLRLRNVGGALPAATPSLAGATDYFSRRVTDDSIQIYDSNAHALAGGSTGLVDITGSGSGTTTIEFGLPYALPTVFAAQGIQLRPFVVGAVWNALVALYSLLTGQAQSVWSGITLAGQLSVSGGQLIVNSVISPTTITTSLDINDWAPTGLSTAHTVRQAISNSGVGFNITGLTGGVPGRRLIIHMLGTGGNITLVHESGSSSAANRFSLASGSNLAVPQLQGGVELEYDGTSSRWRVIGKNF